MAVAKNNGFAFRMMVVVLLLEFAIFDFMTGKNENVFTKRDVSFCSL